MHLARLTASKLGYLYSMVHKDPSVYTGPAEIVRRTPLIDTKNGSAMLAHSIIATVLCCKAVLSLAASGTSWCVLLQYDSDEAVPCLQEVLSSAILLLRSDETKRRR